VLSIEKNRGGPNLIDLEFRRTSATSASTPTAASSARSSSTNARTSRILFFAIGALVLDVGNLYWERRQLQNAADAAAMAAAQEIAATGSEELAYEEARDYADANNSRGAFVGVSDFIVDGDTVTVIANTGSQSSLGSVRSIFASLIGVDAYATSARATVEIRTNITQGKTLPLALCQSNWEHNTGAVPPYDDGPYTSGPPPHIISFATAPGHADPANADCGNPSVLGNSTYPGGFGWLQRDEDEDCMAVISAPDYVTGSTGNSPHGGQQPSACSTSRLYADLREVIDSNADGSENSVLIPIFYDWDNSGSNGKFRIQGLAGFVLKGYKINSSAGGVPDVSYPSDLAWNTLCPNPRSCLYGYYDTYIDIDSYLSGVDDENDAALDFGTRGNRFR
jgi:Flp pilus assembly protein TadG